MKIIIFNIRWGTKIASFFKGHYISLPAHLCHHKAHSNTHGVCLASYDVNTNNNLVSNYDCRSVPGVSSNNTWHRWQSDKRWVQRGFNNGKLRLTGQIHDGWWCCGHKCGKSVGKNKPTACLHALQTDPDRLQNFTGNMVWSAELQEFKMPHIGKTVKGGLRRRRYVRWTTVRQELYVGWTLGGQRQKNAFSQWASS